MERKLFLNNVNKLFRRNPSKTVRFKCLVPQQAISGIVGCWPLIERIFGCFTLVNPVGRLGCDKDSAQCKINLKERMWDWTFI